MLEALLCGELIIIGLNRRPDEVDFHAIALYLELLMDITN
jgi:hypothetical protein